MGRLHRARVAHPGGRGPGGVHRGAPLRRGPRVGARVPGGGARGRARGQGHAAPRGRALRAAPAPRGRAALPGQGGRAAGRLVHGERHGPPPPGAARVGPEHGAPRDRRRHARLGGRPARARPLQRAPGHRDTPGARPRRGGLRPRGRGHREPPAAGCGPGLRLRAHPRRKRRAAPARRRPRPRHGPERHHRHRSHRGGTVLPVGPRVVRRRRHPGGRDGRDPPALLLRPPHRCARRAGRHRGRGPAGRRRPGVLVRAALRAGPGRPRGPVGRGLGVLRPATGAVRGWRRRGVAHRS